MGDLAIEIKDLNIGFKDKQIIDSMDLRIEKNKIYGLLGKNGAGKTTMLNSIVGGLPGIGGIIEIDGINPYSNPSVLDKVCMIREQDVMGDEYKAKDILRNYHIFYENYDKVLEAKLVAFFELPLKKRLVKYSRGMKTLLMNIVGICSRAEIVIYDEPTLGLDAVNRAHFYEILLEQYAKFPQTIIISTHQIEEIENLLEEVIVIDQGKAVIEDSLEDFKKKAWYITGEQVVMQGLDLLRDEVGKKQIGTIKSYSYYGEISEQERAYMNKNRIEYTHIDLQKFFVEMTKGKEFSDEGN